MEKYKTMPHSIEAEQSVLGSMMIDNEAPLVSISALSSDDFYSTANREIVENMMELNRQLKPIDFVPITDLLENTGKREAVG